MDILTESLILRIKTGLKIRGIIPTFYESKKSYDEIFTQKNYVVGSMYRMIHRKIVYACETVFGDDNTRDAAYLTFLSDDVIGACSLAIHDVSEGQPLSADMRVLVSIRSLYIGNNNDKSGGHTKGSLRFSVFAPKDLSVNDIYGEVDIGGELQFYKLLTLENSI